MTNDGFNGTTVVFASATLGSITGCDFSASGAKIDVTDSDDARHTYEVGIPDEELTVDFVGATGGVGVGSEGSLTITWTDGTVALSTVNCKVTSVKASGKLDGPLSCSATFVPSPS